MLAGRVLTPQMAVWHSGKALAEDAGLAPLASARGVPAPWDHAAQCCMSFMQSLDCVPVAE
jgi:hypothetical protein